MKALNKTRFVTIKYPRNTPRISRKRDWYDRSEWRQDPQATLEGSKAIIDTMMNRARNPGALSETPYPDFKDLVNRAGRVGIRKV